MFEFVWTLKVEYIVGGKFTMGGIPIIIKNINDLERAELQEPKIDEKEKNIKEQTKKFEKKDNVIYLKPKLKVVPTTIDDNYDDDIA